MTYLRRRKDPKEKDEGGETNDNSVDEYLQSSCRIGSTPDITSNQTPDTISQSQCELISTLIIYIHTTQNDKVFYYKKNCLSFIDNYKCMHMLCVFE